MLPRRFGLGDGERRGRLCTPTASDGDRVRGGPPRAVRAADSVTRVHAAAVPEAMARRGKAARGAPGSRDSLGDDGAGGSVASSRRCSAVVPVRGSSVGSPPYGIRGARRLAAAGARVAGGF